MRDAAQDVEGVRGHLPTLNLVCRLKMTDRKRTRKPLPSQERLNELFRYDPETGKLIRKISVSGGGQVGTEAGNTSSSGQRRICVDYITYPASHVIWMMMHGETVEHPKCIWYIDGNPLNLALRNLEIVSKKPNTTALTEDGRRTLPTQARLLELFSYSKDTGELTCKVRTGRITTAGTVITGHINANGYALVSVDSVHFMIHRVIWRLMTGEDPGPTIDHIDGNPLNNAWVNLRKATYVENGRNARIPKNNKSGVTGVHFNSRTKKWVSQIGENSGRRWIGNYDTFEEAVAARKAAEKRLGYHENHGLRRATAK